MIENFADIEHQKHDITSKDAFYFYFLTEINDKKHFKHNKKYMKPTL